MKVTRLATWRANPISWVTTTMVMPSRASWRMTASTSLRNSGSSAEVGSSNSSTLGDMASARAMATRCCWPPERRPGCTSRLSESPTLASSASAISMAAGRLMRFTRKGASMMFWSTLMCGQRLKCWNTMPMSGRTSRAERRSSELSFAEEMVTPFITTVPALGCSSRARHRSSVVLPEPEGPMRHTTSLGWTARSTRRSTSTGPKLLLTSWAAISGTTNVGSPCNLTINLRYGLFVLRFKARSYSRGPNAKWQ